uniref:Immunoglobulin V-set domain-containing protein n=1 Tax=Taeniopygia guttata TaxID=59729 RepID=A0A674H9V1_TAEGU
PLLLSQLCSLFLLLLPSAELSALRLSSECVGQESLNLLQWMFICHSFTAMYWFVRHSKKNSSLTLLASAIEGGNAAVEKGFESHFKSSKIKGDSITLSIEHAFLNDSGTYYCAESAALPIPGYHIRPDWSKQ